MNKGMNMLWAFARRGVSGLRAQSMTNVLQRAWRGLCVAAMLAATVSAQAQTVTFSASPNPSIAGQSVVLSASVSGGTPTGAITFKDGATSLGTVPLASGAASLTLSTLSVGTHSLVAAHGGTATWNPADKGTTASLSGGNLVAAVPANGSVRSTLGVTSGKWYYEATLTAYQYVLIGVGTADAITSTYPGDNAESWSMFDYQGQKYHNSVSSAYGTQVAIGSVVGVLVDMDNRTLAFRVNGVDKGVAFTNLPATKAVYAMVGGGTNSWSSIVTANFGGTPFAYPVPAGYNAGFGAAGTSTAVSQVVQQATSSTTLSLAQSSATVGQVVTLSARVQGTSPSGTVTFSDAGAPIGTASLVAGQASLPVNNLALGSHSLTASYAGDANNTASASGASTLTVSSRPAMTWQYGYDAMGRTNSVVDGNALASYIYHDSLGRPIQTQQPANTGSGTPTVISMAYNLEDSLASVIDPRNLATSYSPNGLGTVASQSSPDTASSTFSYDAKGNLLTSVDARGKQTSYAYDSLDRLTSIGYPTGTGTAFQYDGGATPTPAEKGELTKITDESGQTSYAHDALGRLTTKTVTIGSKTFSTGYSWGDSGSVLDKLTAITYPSGSRINYSYDAQGAISAISVNPVNANGAGYSGTAQALLGTVTYNADSSITGWLWSDAKARTIGYDSTGLVSSYTLGDPLGTGTTAGSLRSVSRDSAGRITGYSHTNNGTAVATLGQTFGYDNLNRLLTASLNGAGTAYSYDATGNRTSKTVGATSYTNTVATTSNRLTQTQDVGGTATVTYDAAGHITGDGTNTYTYSDRGRMVSATTPGGTVTYVYNALNQRVGKSGSTTLVPTGAAYYLYDEAGQLLGEYDANGAPISETVYLGSLPVGVLKQTGTAATSDIAVTMYNVHADHIATARVITRQDHTIVWRWDSAEAFGATAPDQNPSSLGTFTFNQRFPGQVFDAETGLFQNWNREYNARQGRYIQSDPIGLAGGINTFAYVDGDPLTGNDPLGLATVRGGTAAQGATYAKLLKDLEAKIQEATCKCPDKTKQLVELFSRWSINISSSPMPSDSDGKTVGQTLGRKVATTFYSNTAPSLPLLAHEFAHTIPQNVNKTEAGGAYGMLPHSQRPFEQEARKFETALSSGQDICSLFTGEALAPNALEEFYRSRDHRALWKRIFGIQ